MCMHSEIDIFKMAGSLDQVICMTETVFSVKAPFKYIVHLCLQAYLAITNLTTNESINYKRYKHMHDKEGKFRNPFNCGWRINLLEFFHIVPLNRDLLDKDDDNETM